MPFLFHAIIFLSYASFAAMVAVVLPQNLPGVDSTLAMVAGAVVLVACGLLHEAYARFEARRELGGEVAAMRGVQESLLEELAKARGETRGLYEALESAGGRSAARPDIGEIVAEVKVLEGLVKQLSKRNAQRAAAEAAPQPSAPQKREQKSEPPSFTVAKGLDSNAVLGQVRQALNTGRVDLFLQPIVSLPQRKTRHYECFSRIRVAEDQILMPDQYIGVAEREGLIGAIDNMLLFRCVQLVRKHQSRMRNVGFFCNISPHSLSDKPFLKDFVDFMGLNSNLAGNLVFELSQAAVNHVDDDVIRSLDRLASLGFRFSVDQIAHLNMNFGELARHRVKFLKVESGVLLSHIQNPRPGFSLGDMKSELNRFGIDLIAEKIENEQTLIELLDYPIAFGQGFLFGEPRLAREDA